MVWVYRDQSIALAWLLNSEAMKHFPSDRTKMKTSGHCKWLYTQTGLSEAREDSGRGEAACF
jgi:hypothetical protein